MPSRIDVFVETHENWYPSYALNSWYNGKKPGDTKLLKVSFLGNICSDPNATPIYRTCVWGADDFGMEFDHPDLEVVHRMFLTVISLQDVNAMSKGTLKDLGFVYA